MSRADVSDNHRARFSVFSQFLNFYFEISNSSFDKQIMMNEPIPKFEYTQLHISSIDTNEPATLGYED